MYYIQFTVALRDALKLSDMLHDSNKNHFRRVNSEQFIVDEEEEDYWYDKLMRNGIEVVKREFIY